MKETPDGLGVEATLDLEESALARQVWRLVKADSVGLSFGYLVTDERDTATSASFTGSICLRSA